MNLEKQQLFLLHFAGGNCYSYQFLKERLESSFEFIPIELPGRGQRMGEQLIVDRKLAVNDLTSQILKKRNGKPFIIYGHSMGASLGLQVVEALENAGESPKRLVVSGNPGPGVKDNKKRYLMNDEALKKELRELGGVPEEVLTIDELYSFFVPIMKADFELIEKEYGSDITCRIKAPIYALMGDREEKVEEIENWRKFTKGHFDFEVLPGNHFFIHNNAEELTTILEETHG